MALRPILLPLLLVCLFGAVVTWLLLAEPPAEPEVASKIQLPSQKTEEEPTSLAMISEARTKAAPLPNEIRNVSPEGVTPPTITGVLTRVEPSETYQKLKDPPVEPIPDGPLQLHRPRVPAAGILIADDMVVHLAHVTALKVGETCVSRLGGQWPCGVRARTSLRGLVRLFTITCEKVEEIGPREISAVCYRRKTDLGAWLTKYGWADPEDSAPQTYHELAKQAREKKIGKWQSEWLSEPLSAAAETELSDSAGLEALLPSLTETDPPLSDGAPLNPFDLPESDFETLPDLAPSLNSIEPSASLPGLQPAR
ncbi:thermonuclease family protein [Labrenzia sp. CE80]|uniref:thermonuclease family protein n=1 Tax=Labrenzia sp. CE80 TaxID=1788986 RepID=UPI00129B11A4|nr:thermonuclease family protein [Labrenzia sp. CE80]